MREVEGLVCGAETYCTTPTHFSTSPRSAQILSLSVAAHFQVICMISLKVGLVAFSAALLQVIWMISLEWAGIESPGVRGLKR